MPGADDADGPHRPGALGGAAGRRAWRRRATTSAESALGVGVEAAAGLPAQQPRGHHLLDDRAGRVQPVARLLVHRVEDLVGGVDADEVHQRQRAHRQAAAQPHGGVDVLAAGVAVLVHRDGVVEVAEQQRVGDEAGLVADRDVDLAQPRGQRLDVVDDRRLGDDGAHDLDQLHDRRRVEEVHPDDLARPAGDHRELGDRQARGVGGQDRVRRADLVQLGEDLGLELHALGHGLDDQLGVGEVLQRRAEADPLEDRVPVRRVELAAAHRPVGGLLEVAAAAGQRLVVDLDGGDRQARPGEHLGDAGTHGAQPHDADLVQFPGHAAISSHRR